MSKRRTMVTSVGVTSVATVAAATLIYHVGSHRDNDSAHTPRSDRAALVSALMPPDGADTFRPYERLADMLPNVGHVSRLAPKSPPYYVTDSVVRGRAVDIVEDGAFVETGVAATEGRPGAKPTDYDDPSADWRTLEVSVDVSEVLAGAQTSRLTFTLPLLGSSASGQDGTAVARALFDLGELVVFSRQNPGGPEYVGIARQLPDPPFGLAQVDERDNISFPLAGQQGGKTSTQFSAGVNTLSDLRAEVGRPGRTKDN